MDINTRDIKAGLFGQKHASRDYTRSEYWGKNQFNSSFPASLVAYMSSKSIDPVYISIDDKNKIQHSYISPKTLFGIDPLSEDLYYGFESGFPQYDKHYIGRREHLDLVLSNYKTNTIIKGLEIKLTALPDSTTDNFSDDKFSSELVIRPSTICYLVCSICEHYNTKNDKDRLKELLGQFPKIKHWDIPDEVIPYYPQIVDAIGNVAVDMWNHQTPLIIQPVWKTLGRKSQLANDCLDVFVWSNLAAIHMCTQTDKNISKIARHNRTIIWIYRMLHDFYVYGHFDYEEIINDLSYGTKNDKAFAISGQVSYPLLKSAELTRPRIKKDEIKNIILGGGQNLLSPERRFDAILVNSPDLFV